MKVKVRLILLVFVMVVAFTIPVFASSWTVYGSSNPYIYRNTNGNDYIYFKGSTSSSIDPDYISLLVNVYDEYGYFFEQIYATDTDNYISGRTEEYLWYSGEIYSGYGTHRAIVYHWYGDDVKTTYSSF